MHVGDNKAHVVANRMNMLNSLMLPGDPAWLHQTHSNQCVVVEDDPNRTADAAITRRKDMPLVIMTADCLPIVLCDQAGTEIAAIHAGWRGLANGIVENTLNNMQCQPETLLDWIGHAICGDCYEVGNDMREAYATRYPYTAVGFRNTVTQCYANLPQIAELILKKQGVGAIYQSGACSFELENEFYSYRRESQTGRMATVIWFSSDV